MLEEKLEIDCLYFNELFNPFLEVQFHIFKTMRYINIVSVFCNVDHKGDIFY